MFDKKDLARVQSLTNNLVQKVTFNGLSVSDINYLKADFEWLSGLQQRIVQDLQQQEANLRKAQAEEEARKAIAEAAAQAEIPAEEGGELNEGFEGEEPPKKKVTKKKTRRKKKVTKKKTS